MAIDAPPTMTDRALGISRRFTRPDLHPYDEVAWGPRDARIAEPGKDGAPERVIFEQLACEFPLDWSDTAVRIVATHNNPPKIILPSRTFTLSPPSASPLPAQSRADRGRG
jgi:ribonucleoside-diphosphate reductase alpha chain